MVCDPKEASGEWTRTGKLNTKKNWETRCLWLWATEKNIWFVNKCKDFWFGEERHLSGCVKIAPGKCILRATRLSVECCQNLISSVNTGGYLVSGRGFTHCCSMGQASYPALYMCAPSFEIVKWYVHASFFLRNLFFMYC